MSQQAENRVAVLLDALGRDTAELVLSRLAPARGDVIRKKLAQLKTAPPSAADVDLVLDEYHRTLQFALGKISAEIPDADEDSATERPVVVGAAVERSAAPRYGSPRGGSDKPDRAAQPASSAFASAAAVKPRVTLQVFQPSDDPIDDLNRLEPFQLGRALRDEPPRAIALVLGCLASNKAGATLEQLPSETRNSVFLQISNRPSTSPELLHGLVRATVAKGCLLDRSVEANADSDSDRRTADLLRAMDKQNRTEMLEALSRQDAEAAARVRKLLFRFEDLQRVTNRSLQSLLGEVDTRTLAAALKGADASLCEKVMDNLSSRAKASLKEEIDLLTSLPAAKQKEARTAIAEALGRMDQAGDLVMEE